MTTATGEWSDGNTSFVTVTCWRKLAENLSKCLRKGDPVVVRGRLDVRAYVNKEGERRIAVDVDATSLGHDLSRGVANFQRTLPATGRTAEEAAAAGENAAGEPGATLTRRPRWRPWPATPRGWPTTCSTTRAIEELAREADSAAAPA